MDLTGMLIGWASTAWFWLMFGLVLLLLEVFAPGTFFLWLGVAALVVGGLDLAFDLTWQVQAIAWGVLSLVLLLAGRRYFNARDLQTEDPHLNERASRYLGRVFTLATPLVEDHGSLKVDDTIWRISGPDMSAGTRIKVIGVDGPILKVDRA
ncbi:NfeD family protein [Prosthecodimorpha staleyi]|uniref:NfeD family protein n=1 Tax=Prosthecodimorpha staleyi TaxID=2840188 RepID=A0A947D0Z1_9HYPH|nr:NfeD family protein [Prosthecodimorpha staleyi]MBT9288928.1 NfeD family protein [Prosthecodimorpha staleyi]